MPKSRIEPRSSDPKRISLSIRPRGSWLLSDKITLIFAHVPHIFVYHLDRKAYKRCHFIGWGSPLSIRTSCFSWPSDCSNEFVIYSCYRGQTRSGSHGMEGVEDGLKYRGLRRCLCNKLTHSYTDRPKIKDVTPDFHSVTYKRRVNHFFFIANNI